jgi:hypothetical protein
LHASAKLLPRIFCTSERRTGFSEIDIVLQTFFDG